MGLDAELWLLGDMSVDDWFADWDTQSQLGSLIEWRKAYGIHKWFMDTMGIDDRDAYYGVISRKQLEWLFLLAREAAERPGAAEQFIPLPDDHLPNWYYDDMNKYTVQQLAKVLAMVKNSELFIYTWS